MKALAILLILLGPVIALGSGIYAARESDRRLAIWFQNETAAKDLARIVADARERAEVQRYRATGDVAGARAAMEQVVTALKSKVEIITKLRMQFQKLDAVLNSDASEEEIALLRAMAPAWTVVEPWPGVLLGLGCSAFGTLLLAIVGRRPNREEQDPPDAPEVPEFKWRKG
jgi:hypothetical protein